MKTFLLFFLTTAAATSSAAIINWTNAGNGNWNVIANWDPNQVPGANDTAVITNAGVYTVTLNVSPAIAGLILGGPSGTQTLATAGRTLTLNGEGLVHTNGRVLLSGGALSGTHQIHLAGAMTWQSGAIDTNAAMTVNAGGSITIASAVNHAKFLYGNLTNAGTITWQPIGTLNVGGALHNLAAGVFDAQVDYSIVNAGSNAVIINDGLFLKSAGSGTLNCNVPFVNKGTVDTQAGTLNLAEGSTLLAGCTFTGTGITRLSTGIHTLNGNFHSDNLALNGAALEGNGILTGTLTWTYGQIDEEASLTVATNSALLLNSSGNFTKYVYGNLTNAGTITWQPVGTLNLAGTLHNLASGVFDAQVDYSILNSGSNAVIINDGLFLKSAGSGTLNCNVPFLNSGTVDTQTGTLVLAEGSTLFPECAFTGAGATRLNPGIHTLHGKFHSDNLVLNGAALEGNGILSGTLTWTYGQINEVASLTVATNGTLLLSSAANFTKLIYGNLTNTGTIIWQPAGNLSISGVLHNFPGSLFDAQVDGISILKSGENALIINDGMFRKSSSGLPVACAVPMINNGLLEILPDTLEFSGGYTNLLGTISLAGGTFKTAEPLSLASGLLTGWGAVGNSVINGAVIRPSCSNGVLVINGNYEQLLGGRLELDVAGNVPGSNQSRLNIAGTATLRGIVGVRWGEGYVPSPGTAFPMLTFGSRQGQFGGFDNCILLGQGRRLEPVYTDTSFTMTTLAASEPTEVPLHVSVDNGALVHWPLEFTGYQLYSSTNLSQPNWTLCPATNCYLESLPLPREKFFRLSKP